jgi:hypothetical protein
MMDHISDKRLERDWVMKNWEDILEDYPLLVYSAPGITRLAMRG